MALEPEEKHSVDARTYRATVQYDGTNYYGFQRQRRGIPSVQAELELALARLLARPVRVLGAGRTDTGVHALGQVIGFTIEWPEKHGLEALHRALNANLPQDIVVSELTVARLGFHPRFDARRRSYAYHILNVPIRQPFWRHRAWHVVHQVGLDRMNEAAALLVGVHDFATFGRPTVGESTTREVYSAAWRRDEQMVTFEICANGFLYRMVRSIVGSLKMVGCGQWSISDFAEALAARERKRSATLAPAHGLYLVSVEYDNE